MLVEFDSYLQWQLGTSVDEFARLQGKYVAKHLCNFGQELFQQGRSRGGNVLVILAFAGMERSLRRTLQSAWDLATTKQAITPAHNHAPTPPAVVWAFVSLALA